MDTSTEAAESDAPALTRTHESATEGDDDLARIAGDDNGPSQFTETDHDHPVFATVYNTCMWGFEATILPKHREHLTQDLSGRILDLGSGTGAMFPYYRAAIDDGVAIDLAGIEPDSYMRARAERVAADIDIDINLRGTPAEALPFPDSSFDIVIAALVFCTIDDPAVALDEVARVLKPGGEFRFFEHVADEGWRRGVQTAVTPIWKRVLFTGCHLNRDTPALFEHHDAFDVAELDRFNEVVTPLRVLARGVLRRRLPGEHDRAG